MPDSNPRPGIVIKRTVISVILLMSLKECMNVIAMLSDGVSTQINGVGKLLDLLGTLKQTYDEAQVDWFNFKEALIFVLNLLSYIVAYLGIFVANALIHFTWAILYVCSPLMILMFVNERTSFVTKNLYRGLISVSIWKVMWSILGVMLLKFATSPEIADGMDNFLTSIIVNLCIAVAMLLVPFTTKSLIYDGMTNSASGLAVVPALASTRVIKQAVIGKSKKAAKYATERAKMGAKHISRPIVSRFSSKDKNKSGAATSSNSQQKTGSKVRVRPVHRTKVTVGQATTNRSHLKGTNNIKTQPRPRRKTNNVKKKK